ncbi:tyrosine-type recombinase/integrase [Lacticaseibacillus brantae]|uniref:Site-specific recombinase, phage integrase family n=1 Tax=Lacticaseibacillus brantae DSM 23927 TaxID=1423727 RepID=A0A0R2BA52_9LACO|nr:site-specific integrase [Lacticaseibacillus brantae]KRM73046.1 site-specific recombinase, phage integrase family [Lacticaseibacillus brantae DSM 23927]
MTTYKQYIKKNGEKKWRVQGYLGMDPKTGLQKRTTLNGFNTKIEAKDAFERAIYDFKFNTSEPEPDKRTVQSVFDEWWPMYTQTVESSTSNKTKQIFEHHVLPSFGSMYISKVQIIDAEKWSLSLAKKMSSYGKVLSYAGMLFKFAMRMGYLTKNPFEYIERPRRHKKAQPSVTQNYYSVEELHAFVSALHKLASDESSSRWIMAQAFLLLAVSTGLRRGELLGLKWSDLDLNAGNLTVKRAIKRDANGSYVGGPKNENAYRTVMLEPMVMSSLQQLRMQSIRLAESEGLPAISPDQWLFPSNNNPDKVISSDTPRKWMMDLSESTGVRRITIHGLRHTKATLMSEAGITPSDIAKILGHASGEFTMKHYIHATDDGVKKAESIYGRLLENVVEM